MPISIGTYISFCKKRTEYKKAALGCMFINRHIQFRRRFRWFLGYYSHRTKLIFFERLLPSVFSKFPYKYIIIFKHIHPSSLSFLSHSEHWRSIVWTPPCPKCKWRVCLLFFALDLLNDVPFFIYPAAQTFVYFSLYSPQHS